MDASPSSILIASPRGGRRPRTATACTPSAPPSTRGRRARRASAGVEAAPLAADELGVGHHRVPDPFERRAQRRVLHAADGSASRAKASARPRSGTPKSPRRSRRWRSRSCRAAHRSGVPPCRAPAAGPGDRAPSTSRPASPAALACRAMPACLPEQLWRRGEGGSPSRIRRSAVSRSKGRWVPQASTSRVRPPARRTACTVRACRSSPECEAAMIASASVGAGKS